MNTATATRRVPVEPGLPFIGQSFSALRRGGYYLMELQKRHGSAVTLSLFGFKFTMLFGPEANKLVYQNAEGLFESSQWEALIGPFFHRGLMLLDGGEHRLHRRIMLGAFTNKAQAGYFSGMQPRILHDMDTWQPGEDFLVFDHLKAMTLNVGSEVFFGAAPGPEADEMNHSFLHMVQAATGIVRHNLPGTRWRRGLQGRAFLEAYFGGEIGARRKNPGTDLFSKLCEARTEDDELFSDDDVINHIIFVLMAAHDTSTITTSNMVYQLAKHPEWQDRLRAQSQALCDAKGKTTLDYEDLAQLTDIELVFKETLRLCAPVPYVPRRLTQDIEFEGYHLPAGIMVSVSPWVTHYMEKFWDNPWQFDPERFTPERAQDITHRYQWVPFGGGAHHCIGFRFGEMEIKTILHQMLLRYRWSVPENYKMRQDFTSLPIPKDRLPVRLEHL